MLKTLEDLVDPIARSAPESPLKWISKSVRKLEEAMLNAEYFISYRSTLLHELGYKFAIESKN
ncbi:ISAzo13-like element transposase-related protein [Holospora obtusa]|uniref:ISAzo13-like element transposase-related protein n=1 Tax=Holospora obtusa TaxID=49893 RepID=UPI0012EB4F35